MKRKNAPAVLGYIKGKPVYEVGGGTSDVKEDVKTKPTEVAIEVFKGELQKALKEHEDQLAKTFQKYEDDLEKYGSVTEATKADLKKMSEDYASMQKDVDGILQARSKFLDGKPMQKSPGKSIVESDDFKKMQSGESRNLSKQFDENIFMKNTILGEAGSPQNPVDTIVPMDNMAGIIGGAFRMLNLLDVLPFGITGSNTIHYTRELSYTNAAAETAEGAAKPQSTLTFEDAEVPVRTIAHWLKVSKQVMDDAPALQSYIDMRLRHGVRQRLQDQIIAGNGTSPNISGILDTGNFTALSPAATTGDVFFDTANVAKYQVVTSDYMPDVYLMNPGDWGSMERAKDSSGQYLGREGAINYLANGLIPTLWGLPVILSNSVTAGKIICASLQAVMGWLRQSAVVTIFEQDEDNVQKNLLTVRGEMRAAFTVFRPAAIVVGDLL